MKSFLKSLGVALWTRVVVAYKSTLLGIAIAVADVILQQLDAVQMPQWAHALVALVAAALALYKGKAKVAPQDAPAPVQVPSSGAEAAKIALRN